MEERGVKRRVERRSNGTVVKMKDSAAIETYVF